MNVVNIDRHQQALSLIRQAMALLDGGAAPLSAADRLLRMEEVERVTGLKKTVIYAQVKAEAFPASVKLGPRAVAWRESEVQAWVEARGTVKRA